MKTKNQEIKATGNSVDKSEQLKQEVEEIKKNLGIKADANSSEAFIKSDAFSLMELAKKLEGIKPTSNKD